MGEIQLWTATCNLVPTCSVPACELGGARAPIVRGVGANAVGGAWGIIHLTKMQKPTGCLNSHKASMGLCHLLNQTMHSKEIIDK